MLFRPVAFYEERSIELVLGDPVEEIDLERRVARTRAGREIGFDQLVLATGAVPNRLPVPGAQLPGVFVLRSLEDARGVRAALSSAQRVVVIGGGFIGCEVAASARTLGKQVALVETCQFCSVERSARRSEPRSRGCTSELVWNSTWGGR
jgi:3-phenylpropionate/trans-cinnamate dioxygenase ferredoxin reductase subunit